MNQELSPLDVFDPVRSTGMYAGFIRGLMRHPAWALLPPSEQTVLALRRGSASLTLLPDYAGAKERSRSIRRHLPDLIAEAGVNPAFASQRLLRSDWDRWPGTWDAIRRVEDAYRRNRG